MDTSIFLNTVFGSATVASLIIALRENKQKDRAKAAEKRIRDMYQTLCRSKCMTLTGTARDLSENTARSCFLIRKCSKLSPPSDNSKHCQHASQLTGFMYSIRTATNHLIDYCKVINDEYVREFNEPVFENFEKDLPVVLCNDDFLDQNHDGMHTNLSDR